MDKNLKKLLTLNIVKKTCGPNMAIAVKLLRFGGKPFFPQNGGWAPQKGGHDPPFEEKRGSRQKNNTEMYSGLHNKKGYRSPGTKKNVCRPLLVLSVSLARSPLADL
jgi:hypothetical protein